MKNKYRTSSTDLPAKASVRTMPVKPIMAVLPFQFSALGVQMPFAKGSLRVYPLHMYHIKQSGTELMRRMLIYKRNIYIFLIQSSRDKALT